MRLVTKSSSQVFALAACLWALTLSSAPAAETGTAGSRTGIGMSEATAAPGLARSEPARRDFWAKYPEYRRKDTGWRF